MLYSKLQKCILFQVKLSELPATETVVQCKLNCVIKLKSMIHFKQYGKIYPVHALYTQNHRLSLAFIPEKEMLNWHYNFYFWGIVSLMLKWEESTFCL